MRLLAIDPGPVESAYLIYDVDAQRPVSWEKWPNEHVLSGLDGVDIEELAIEMVASYGMAVGAEVFETCVWAGRFIERWHCDLGSRRGLRARTTRVTRKQVVLHVCNSPRASDPNIRAALIDRYGPGKEAAIGRKASPGPLYGLAGDCWSALAVAVTAAERLTREAEWPR